MEKVIEILSKYKDATVMLIDEIDKDGDMEKYIDQRRLFIEELQSLECEKDVILNKYSTMGIEKLELQATDRMKNKRESIKKEMIELKRNKAAAVEYNSSYKNINLLNKKI